MVTSAPSTINRPQAPSTTSRSRPVGAPAARPVGPQARLLVDQPATAPKAAAEEKKAEPKRSMLAGALSGRLDSKLRILVYGEPGVGKTTIAAGAPNPIFLCSEDGSDEYNVTRLRIHSWQELLDTLDELESAHHPYESIVLDTIDHFEPMLYAFVCARDNKPNIESYGFQKGQKTVAPAEMRVMVNRLERLNRRFHVILLAHSAMKKIKKADMDDYDAYGLKMSAESSAFFMEWSTACLFAMHDVVAAKGLNDERMRGIATGDRMLKCHFGAAWTAKNRYGLPEELPLDWAKFAGEIDTGRALLREMDALGVQLGKLSQENGEIARVWLLKPHSREELLAMKAQMLSMLEPKGETKSEPKNEAAEENKPAEPEKV